MKHFFQWSQVSAFRLTRHHFVDQDHAELTAVCQDVCGIQSQVMAAAEMALWARMHRLARADIHSALYESRTLVKTSSAIVEGLICYGPGRGPEATFVRVSVVAKAKGGRPNKFCYAGI